MEKDRKLIVLGNPQGGSTNVQSDWNETNTSSPAYIKNKPTISDAEIVIKQNNVTKGSFTLNQNGSATINLEGGGGGGSTQVQANWEETDTEAVSYIQNKPSLATVATTGSYSDLSGTPSLANVATSGSYNDLSNKPTIPAAQIQSDWNQSDNTQLDYIKNKPTIPAAQIQSDWNASSGVAQILNKPSMTTETLTFIDSNNVETNVVVYVQPQI